MSETKLGKNSKISDMGIEQEFRDWLEKHGNEGDGLKVRSRNTYWSLIHNLPAIDIKEEDTEEIIEKWKRNINKKKKISVLKQFLKFQVHHHKNNGELDDISYSKLENKAVEIMSSLKAMAELGAGLDHGSEYDTVDEHYVKKRHLVELLRQSTPQRAKFFALQYYGGFRFSELKLVQKRHKRTPEEEEPYGGVRIQKNRSKSKFSRTVEFRSEIPYKLLEEQIDRLKEEIKEEGIPEWTDDDDITWKKVIFWDIEQSKMNYRLGKKVKKDSGKIKYYGTYGQIAGDHRTLHSLRHTRITDLVSTTEMTIEEVRQRSGHSLTDRTNEYTEHDIENPQTLESYCEENNIDIIDVINS